MPTRNLYDRCGQILESGYRGQNSVRKDNTAKAPLELSQLYEKLSLMLVLRDVLEVLYTCLKSCCW